MNSRLNTPSHSIYDCRNSVPLSPQPSLCTPVASNFPALYYICRFWMYSQIIYNSYLPDCQVFYTKSLSIKKSTPFLLVPVYIS